ncbi:TonB-dependent receptor [Pseudoteredinibacter isoporae]|uniref:Iron complex outermembrane receptor protein n=1 Tax=Pseudoteredinibacter isoporae TaxID=570281 RepID=A0A7X0MVH6_9GAMM|nr:TonB-dependent receptor [Pseudoteredinibacter isoporae]MBB6521130.1 iron complex outermembrane receptor protein [Pseudoteredinibacter isoporae]NHO86691.1 TonB-dependent receptor [Pseudoteredinibacter isoporae]NIB24857.1 TonB-dependent receptor [Pseudoteredinibacter isoporae]
MSNTRIGAFALLALIGGGQNAIAQAVSEENSLALEEIVVTARMRAESLQDVPISETAFSAQTIEDSRIETADDFLALSPNVTLANSQSAGVSFMTIRGISQVRNGEAPVAVVVDGVLQINNRQLTQSMIDMQSIEVLRGPQGALYGRNAAGGAILISSNQPSDEFEGFVKTTVGKGDEFAVTTAFGGPIIENTLKYRIAARYQDIDGYLNNKQLAQKVDGIEDKTFRGILQWDISDQLTATLRGSTVRTEGGGLNFQYQPVEFDGNSCNTSNPFGGPTPDADNVSREFCANNLGYNERDIDELSIKLDYDTDAVSFTNIFSYNNVTEYGEADQFPYTNEVDVFGLFDGSQTQFVDVKAWSYETRLASNDESPLQWMIGAYYLETERFISTTTGDDNRLGIERIERTPKFNSAINPTVSFIADDNDNRAWALFGNVSYDLSEDLEIALALRYDEDKREQNISPLNTAGLPVGCTVANPAACQQKETYSKLQPKVSIRYALGEDANVYASYGEGFRSGQFNQFGVAVAAANAGVIGVSDRVDAEVTKTAEIGIKSELLDNRLRLNAGIFHTKTNPLYFVFVGAVGAQVLVNIDDVRLIGGEIEAAFSVSEGLDIYAGFGYTDSEIQRNTLNPTTVGNEAPYIAENTFNMGAQYRTDITDDIGFVARIDYERRGAQFWDPENSTDRSALNLVNARMGIEATDGKWSLTAASKNLTDKAYNSEWVLGGFAHPATPRTWHVDFKYNF